MSKGYWIVHLDITDPDNFKKYLDANKTAMVNYGANYLARAGNYECVEGQTRARNTVIEFPSYQAALDCWRSEDYQRALAFRKNAAEIDIVIVEGVSEQ